MLAEADAGRLRSGGCRIAQFGRLQISSDAPAHDGLCAASRLQWLPYYKSRAAAYRDDRADYGFAGRGLELELATHPAYPLGHAGDLHALRSAKSAEPC